MEASGAEPGPEPASMALRGAIKVSPPCVRVFFLVTRILLCLILTAKPPEPSVASSVKRGCYGVNGVPRK